MNGLDKALGQPWVQALLDAPLLARLATANARTNQPHVVPVWFEWDGEAMWISSFNSTRKMRDLEGNPLVSVVIDIAEGGENARGIVLEGAAEVVSDPGVVVPRSISIYERYLGVDSARAPEPASWVVDPDNRVIKLTPMRVYTWGG